MSSYSLLSCDFAGCFQSMPSSTSMSVGFDDATNRPVLQSRTVLAPGWCIVALLPYADVRLALVCPKHAQSLDASTRILARGHRDEP